MEWLPWGDDPNSFYFLRLTERTRSYGLRNAGSIPVGSVFKEGGWCKHWKSTSLKYLDAGFLCSYSDCNARVFHPKAKTQLLNYQLGREEGLLVATSQLNLFS